MYPSREIQEEAKISGRSSQSPARREPQIPEQLDYLSSLLSELSERVGTVESRLYPYCTQGLNKVPDKEAAGTQQLCPVATTIETANLAVSSMIVRLDILINSMEI